MDAVPAGTNVFKGFNSVNKVGHKKALQNNIYIGSEVLTAVAMKSSSFGDITPCSLLKGDVSEEYVASMFRVEEKDKQETSLNQVASNHFLSVSGWFFALLAVSSWFPVCFIHHP
jgi:hypothetical protein